MEGEQPYLGDLRSPWLLTTYPNWHDPPSVPFPQKNNKHFIQFLHNNHFPITFLIFYLSQNLRNKHPSPFFSGFSNPPPLPYLTHGPPSRVSPSHTSNSWSMVFPSDLPTEKTAEPIRTHHSGQITIIPKPWVVPPPSNSGNEGL